MPTVLIATPIDTVCTGTSINFTALATNGGTAPNYQWKVNNINHGTSNNSFSYTPLNGDVVNCLLTSNATCATPATAISNNIKVIVTPLAVPTISISTPQSNICEGTSINLTATTTNGGTSPTYQWQVNGTSAGANSSAYSYLPRNGDKVDCLLSSSASCIMPSTANSNLISISTMPLPSKFLPSDTSFCSYSQLILAPTNSFNSYLWSSGATTPNIIITQAGTYWLQVTDNNNCTGKENVTVSELDCSNRFYMPSAFTPNGDGKNDVLKPTLLGIVKQYKLSIYNR